MLHSNELSDGGIQIKEPTTIYYILEIEKVYKWVILIKPL
jgi:hypothetical protein